MFEHIGIDPDREGGRRRAWASMWATLTVGGLVGAVVGVTALRVVEPEPSAPAPAPFVDLVEVIDDEPEQPPPGLPRRPPGGEAHGDPAPAPPAPPDLAPDVPPPLDPPKRDRMVDDLGPTGTGLQSKGTGAPTGGAPTGGGGGSGGGDGRDRRTVHSSDLLVKKRVEPRYPDSARSLRLGEQKCYARVEIEPDGVPSEVSVTGCPALFHADTEAAVRGWRWWPVKVDGRRAAVVTTIVFVYRLD